MAKATTTIKQVINCQPDHAAWFAANQVLFNQVAAFYFEVIQAHAGVLDLPAKEASPHSKGSPIRRTRTRIPSCR
jgi:hypothetical protein